MASQKTSDPKAQWFIPSEHHCLTTEEVKTVTDDLNYQCSPELVEAITENTSEALRSLDVLDGLSGYLPEVKYPRVPGYKPTPEENTGNAWAWCCDIQGAPGGKLAGKKIAIKDNVAVAGVPMSNGSLVLEGYVPEYDATVTTRVLDAGGRIVGKAACDDFCCSAMGYSSTDRYLHLPNTPDKRVGGSSGGSAVLVATGDVDLAIAGDQGGSIRIPSAWSGVVGMKPTYGLVPYTGIMSIEPSLDHVGPVARNVNDCALFLEVLAGNNGVDPRQTTTIEVPEYSKLLEDTSSNFTVGLLKEGFDTCEEEVVKLVMEFLDSAAVSASDQIETTKVSVPLHASGFAVLVPLLAQGAKSALEMGTTCQFIDGFHSTSLQKAVSLGAKSCGRLFSPGMKQFIAMGEILTRRYGNHYYAKARNVTLEIRRQFDLVLEKCDVIVMPTLTLLPVDFVKEGASRKKNLKQYLEESISMAKNTSVFNLTGHPALTIPLGKVGDPSVPGLMIVGRKFDDLKVLQVGRAFEKLVSAHQG